MQLDGRTLRIDNGEMERLRLFGAAGGAVFAVLAVIAFAIASGPSSANGATVAEYYSAHGTATLWQASLIGFALVCFIWFAGVFSVGTSLGPVVLVSASVTSALYLVAIGAWESLGEIYGRANGSDLNDGDAHALYDVGSVRLTSRTSRPQPSSARQHSPWSPRDDADAYSVCSASRSPCCS